MENPYEVTFKTDSIHATIPIVEGTRSQVASYLPNTADTAYAALPEIQGAKLVEPAIHYIEEYHCQFFQSLKHMVDQRSC